MSPILLAAAALAAPPPLIGDPLTTATQGAFEGPVALLDAPSRLSTQAPAPWAGIGVEDAPLNPGPVGWALLRRGRTTWALAAGYAAYGTTVETTELGESYGYYDEIPPTLTTTTGRRDDQLAELAIGVGHPVGARSAVGVSLRGRALWIAQAVSADGFDDASVTAPGSGDLGEITAMDLDTTAAVELARVSDGGVFRVGLTGSFVRSAERIELETGEFDADGELLSGTAVSGYPEAPLLNGQPNRMGVWPGARLAVDRGGEPGAFRWRLEAAVRGGLLQPASRERRTTRLQSEDYAYLDDSTTTVTFDRRIAAGMDGRVALWHGSGDTARVREGLVFGIATERRSWNVGTDVSSGSTPFPHHTQDAGFLRVEVSAPVALTAPCSERVTLDASIAPGFELARYTTEDTGAGTSSDASLRMPWLAGGLGLTVQALDGVFVHALVDSNPRSLGGGVTGSLPAGYVSPPTSAHGTFGTLPLAASLMISTRPRQKSAQIPGDPAP